MHDTASTPHDHDDQSKRQSNPLDGRAGRAVAADGVAVWADGVEGEIDAENLIQRRPSVRKRAVQVSLALLCVLAVFGLFHTITPAATQSPVTVPLVSAHVAQVRIASNLSYGSVTVNGGKLVGEPPFRLAAGPSGELVTYSAPPFLPQTCRLFWYGSGALARVGADGSACQISFDVVTESNLVNSSYVLSFQFGLAELPVALQATTLEFVRRVITPASLSLAGSSGQYYATGRDSKGMILSRLATTPFTAVVSLIFPPVHGLAPSAAGCSELICPAPGSSFARETTSVAEDYLWIIQVPLIISWQYLRADGQPVGAEHQNRASADMTVALALDAGQHWELAQLTSPETLATQQRQMVPNILCASGITELSDALQNHQAGSFELIVSADHGLAGCEIHMTRYDGTVVGKVVWRLGVLLAADSETLTAYPWLSLAPPAEVSAANGV